LINNTPNASLILTGKIFEYLASKTPIVCIGPEDGDAAQIIGNKKCGEVFGFGEVKLLKDHLLACYKRFKKNELIVKCSSIEEYERKNLTGKIADVLNQFKV
jgi:hypothetical protein